MKVFAQIAAVTVSLCLVAVIIELTSAHFCRKYEITERFVPEALLRSRTASTVVAHPFLAFTTRERGIPGFTTPGRELNEERERRVNFNEYLPPLRPSPDAVVIAFLGNSVAEALNYVPSGMLKLARRLENEVPVLAGKKVYILNLTLFAYKQPQQAIQTLLYQDYFDAVIQLDGFNEAAHPSIGNQHPQHPLLPPQFFGGRQTAAFYLLLASREVHWRFLEILQRSGLASLKSMRLLSYSIDRRIQSRLNEQQIAMNTGPNFDVSAETRADIWANSLRAEIGILNQFKKPAAFFVQPNLHVPGSKPFSEEEKKLIKDGEGFAKVAELGFPALLDAAKKLKATGAPVFDLTQAFQNQKQTLYLDSCCHLNNEGSLLLIDTLADRLIEEWRKEPQAEKFRAIYLSRNKQRP